MIKIKKIEKVFSEGIDLGLKAIEDGKWINFYKPIQKLVIYDKKCFNIADYYNPIIKEINQSRMLINCVEKIKEKFYQQILLIDFESKLKFIRRYTEGIKIDNEICYRINEMNYDCEIDNTFTISTRNEDFDLYDVFEIETFSGCFQNKFIVKGFEIFPGNIAPNYYQEYEIEFMNEAD